MLLEERKAKSITPVQEKITVLVQEFEYEMVKFNVAFNDNTTEEIKLDKSMLSNEDIISLGKPGTYEIEEGKRVIDAINLAGGLTKNTDTLANNLSLKVFDQMVFIF